MTPDDLSNRFDYHPPQTDTKRAAHAAVRDSALHLAVFLNDVLFDGREKSLAITKLEEAMFWANAALARTS